MLNLQSAVTLRPTDSESYLYINDLENRDLTWEKLNELNVGMDYSIFKGRFSGTFDFFTRESFDLIGLMQTSGVGGVAFKFGNYADMSSQGFEVSFNSVNVTNENFTWSTNINLGYARDQIKRLDFGPRLTDAISQSNQKIPW